MQPNNRTLQLPEFLAEMPNDVFSLTFTAHFLGRSKKDVVDAVVREYIEAHRDGINAGVRAALTQLDGSTALALITGLSTEEIDELGGLPPDKA